MTQVEAESLATGAPVPHLGAQDGRARIARDILRDRSAVLGLVIVGALSLAALLAPLLAPHPPDAGDIVNKLAPSSREFPLGTDNLGRDVLSRLLYGARVSISTAVIATLGITAIGVLLGLLSGYAGGAVDALIGRVIDVLLAFPSFLLALALTGVLGTGLRNIILAVVLVAWPRYARILRSAVLAEREKEYVEAARASGATSARILRRQILPNVVGPVVVLTTLDLGAVLLLLSSYSFLGLGVQPPTAEWGAMLNEGRAYMSAAPSMTWYPGTAIFLMALGFNLVGDGLRDLLDPRTPRRGS